jgi:hypothetical protein
MTMFMINHGQRVNMCRALFFLMLPVVCCGQSITVTKGPSITEKEMFDRLALKALDFRAAAEPTQWFYDHQASKAYSLYSTGPGEILVGEWENYITLGELKKLEADFLNPGEKSRVSLLSFLSLAGKQFALYSWKYHDRDELSVYVSELTADMVLTGSPILLKNYQGLKAFGAEVIISKTPDNSVILITRIQDVKGGQQQVFECKALSNTFSELWSRTIILKEPRREVKVQAIQTDNVGNFHLLTEFSPATEYSKSKPTLYSYFWKSGELRKFGLGENEDSYGAKFVIDGNTIIAAGLTRHGRDISCFVNRIDIAAQSITPASMTAMPDGFFREAKYYGNDLNFWKAIDIVIRDDQSWIVLIGARVESDGRAVASGQFAAEDYVISFSPQATPQWISKINRWQQIPSNCLGTYLIAAGDKLFAIHNDATSNLTRAPEDEWKDLTNSAKPCTITVQEIDKNGKAKKICSFGR